MDTPVPFANELEDEFLAKARFETQLKDLLSY
jgi:2-oxoisovalerate dehydrogenase E1 component